MNGYSEEELKEKKDEYVKLANEEKDKKKKLRLIECRKSFELKMLDPDFKAMMSERRKEKYKIKREIEEERLKRIKELELQNFELTMINKQQEKLINQLHHDLQLYNL